MITFSGQLVFAVTLSFTPENPELPMVVKDIEPGGQENIFELPSTLQDITGTKPVSVLESFVVALKPAENTVALVTEITLRTKSLVTVTLDNGQSKTVSIFFEVFYIVFA